MFTESIKLERWEFQNLAIVQFPVDLANSIPVFLSEVLSPGCGQHWPSITFVNESFFVKMCSNRYIMWIYKTSLSNEYGAWHRSYELLRRSFYMLPPHLVSCNCATFKNSLEILVKYFVFCFCRHVFDVFPVKRHEFASRKKNLKRMEISFHHRFRMLSDFN